MVSIVAIVASLSISLSISILLTALGSSSLESLLLSYSNGTSELGSDDGSSRSEASGGEQLPGGVLISYSLSRRLFMRSSSSESGLLGISDRFLLLAAGVA